VQFVVIAYDGENVLERRMASREAHLATCRQYKETGNYIHGGAMLDDDGNMIGSVMFWEFPSREALDEWYRSEPYVVNNVWSKVEIRPFRIPSQNK
jgi:uncharacterized protein YciI